MSTPPPSPSEPLFLFKLNAKIPRPHLVAVLGRLRTNPPVRPSTSATDLYPFVEINTNTKSWVEYFLRQQGQDEKGLFIPLPFPSKKDLHHKLALGHVMMVTPSATRMPVPYFLYDALADSEVLKDMLGLKEKKPVLLDAVVRDGKVRWWKGEYRALVDAEGKRNVRGVMYVVKSVEEEDRLRRIEGSHFEVVRCCIEVEGFEVDALTFKYCGPEEYLVDRQC